MNILQSKISSLLSLSRQLQDLLPNTSQTEEGIRARELCSAVQRTCLNIGRVAFSGKVSEVEKMVMAAKLDEYGEEMEKIIEVVKERNTI